MTTLFIVVPLALLVSGAAVAAFIWSVQRGQMDDLSTPALRMLENDAVTTTPQADDLDVSQQTKPTSDH